MARLVSKVYGEALYEFAKDNKHLEKMYEEARDIIEVFTNNRDINDFLSSPNATEEQKIEFLHDVFINKFWAGPLAKVFRFFQVDVNKGEKPNILDFLSIIIKKGRQKEIVPILKHFTHLTLKEKNIGEAEVLSASELSDKQKESLKDKLVNSTNYNNFIVDYKIDESLIAGLKIKIDDKVLDTTYKTKLFDISKNLRGLKL